MTENERFRVASPAESVTPVAARGYGKAGKPVGTTRPLPFPPHRGSGFMSYTYLDFFTPSGVSCFPRCFRLPRHAPSPCRPMTYMACCKVCCGCKECAEGEEGKCCCGNECCAAGTYCCNAECVSACSEGQEGDCKCTDACCYQGEYCCNDVCIGACAEGDNGPCKCGSSCCESGEYCCDGACQQEPCDGCGPCGTSGVYCKACVLIAVIDRLSSPGDSYSLQDATDDCNSIGGFLDTGGGFPANATEWICTHPLTAYTTTTSSPGPHGTSGLCDPDILPSPWGYGLNSLYCQEGAHCCDGVCGLEECPP